MFILCKMEKVKIENNIKKMKLICLHLFMIVKEIAYINIKDAKSIIEIRPTAKPGTYNDFDTEKRNKIYKLVDSGETFIRLIARLLDMHPSNVRAIFINRHNEDKIVSTRGKIFLKILLSMNRIVLQEELTKGLILNI